MSTTPRVALTLTQCWHRVPGGSATSISELAGALALSRRVDLVGVGPSGDLRSPSTILGSAPPASWPPELALARLPLPLPLLYDAWSRLRSPSIEGSTGDVDLVHVTIPICPPPPSVPLVATVHDVFPLDSPELMTGRGQRLMRQGLERIREEAVRVMVPSKSVAQGCVRHGFDESKLAVVPWGVEPVAGPGAADVSEATQRYGLQTPYVLFVGTVEPRKNLPRLLDAIRRLDRPELTLALVGPPGWGESIDDDIAAVASPVARLGQVPHGDLAPLMHGADVFCFPSLAEGFGLPVLEAMAAGAAVVTSEGTATGEVAGDAAVLVDPLDVDALVAALARLLDDPDRSAALRGRAVRRSAEFTWERAAGAVLDVYESVLA